MKILFITAYLIVCSIDEIQCALYTRWGHNGCPNVPGTQFVYAGRAAGSYYNHRGSGANHLCMPQNPQYSLPTRSGVDRHGRLYGSEYQSPLTTTQDLQVSCAVCLVTSRETVMMLPGRTACPISWTREYFGYLMSAHHDHHRSMYECVDQSQASPLGGEGNENGALFYHVEVDCGYGLQCSPYTENLELTCVPIKGTNKKKREIARIVVARTVASS